MTPFRAATGVVDRLQGLPLPDDITLYAILLSKRPNLDGGGFNPADIVSHSRVRVEFGSNRGELRSRSRVRISLIEGVWSELFVQLQDESGEAVAKGAVSIGTEASHWIEAAPDMITVTSASPRQ